MRRRLVGVPDRGDDDHAARVRVGDRRCLERRVRVAPGSRGSRRPPRLRLITRAPLSTAQRIAFASASSRSCRSRARPSRSGAATGMRSRRCRSVVRSRRDHAGDERPVALGVDVPAPPTKLRAAGDPAREIGCLPSIPESITATRTEARKGRSARATHRTNDPGPRTTRRGRKGSFGTYSPGEAGAPRRTGHRERRAASRRSERMRREPGSGRDRQPLVRHGPGGAERPQHRSHPARGRRRTAQLLPWTARRARSPRRSTPRRLRRRGLLWRSFSTVPSATVTVNAGPAWPSAVSR